MDAAKNLCSRGAEYFNCRVMPHGGLVLFPIVLTTLGLCTSLADDGCDYARLRGAAVEMLTGSADVPFVDCGMTAYRVPGFYPGDNSWRVSYSEECQSYEYMNLVADTSWVAAQWLRFLSVVAGGTTMMFLWSSTCLTMRPNYWKGAGVGAATACFFQVCSFVWFYTKLCHTSTTDFEDFEAGREAEKDSRANDASTCNLFFGSKCAILCCVLYAAASVVILMRKYPVPVPKFVVEEENVAITAALASGLRNPIGRRRDPISSRSTRMKDVGKSVRSNGKLSNSMSTADTSTRSITFEGGRDNTFRASLRTSVRPADIEETHHSTQLPASSLRSKDLSVSESAFSTGSFV